MSQHTFASYLKTLREQKGITKEQLAYRANLSETAITFIEQGGNVSQDGVKQLAFGLGLSDDELAQCYFLVGYKPQGCEYRFVSNPGLVSLQDRLADPTIPEATKNRFRGDIQRLQEDIDRALVRIRGTLALTQTPEPTKEVPKNVVQFRRD